jgi:DNA-binding transcriptional MerR regulator
MAEFHDGKDDEALRTIGEVSEALQIKPHVLRYWEQQFSLLNPLKRSGGRRYYRPEDVALVEMIDRLVNKEGYTLKGAEAVLRAVGGPGFDRRKGDRRAGDRRAAVGSERVAMQVNAMAGPDENDAGEPAATPEPPMPPSPASGPDLADAIARLKAIRARLKRAIEA